MRLKFRLAAATTSALLAISAIALAQSPFDTPPAAAPAVEPAASNPFAAAPAPPAAPVPADAPAPEPAPASPFAAAPTADPVAASPFADTTGAGPTADAALASPFGSTSDVTATDASGAPAQFDPIVYWYRIEIDESAASPAPQANQAQPLGPQGEEAPPPPAEDTSTAIREEIPYSEYKRRYNERVVAIQAVYQNSNEQDWQNRGWDPRAMAEWKVYYEQMEAWKKYVEDTVLDAKVSGSVKDIDFSTLDQAGVQDAAQDLVDNVQNAADLETEKIQGLVVAMVERLDLRRNSRINYDDWRAEQQAVFLDFTERWIKQKQGEEINIDGNMYLISDKPIQNAPRDVLPVVTNYLTPYDIFNDDGTLKRPQ